MLRLLDKYRVRKRAINRGEYWWLSFRPGAVYWARRDADRIEVLQDGICKDFDELPVPRGGRVVLCVPGEFVRSHFVHIPTRNRKRFFAALPYMLEDQLLRAPEAYHFVPMPKQPGLSVTPVAVVGHDKMLDWLEIAKVRDWKLQAVFPDYLALPQPERHAWFLDVTASPFLLRTASSTGAAFAGDINNQLPGPLTLILERNPQMPRVLRVRISKQEQRASLTGWHAALSSMAIEMDVIASDCPREHLLARNDTSAYAYNLLTGSYAVRTERTWRLSNLIPAAGLTGALAVTLAAQAIISHHRARTEYRQLQQEIEEVYRTVFPDARNLIDPRYQMEHWLEEMRAQAQGNAAQSTLITVLEHVAPVILNSGKLEVMALDFDGQVLTLEISAPDFESLSSLQGRLSGKFKADLVNADLKSGRVLCLVRIGGRVG